VLSAAADAALLAALGATYPKENPEVTPPLLGKAVVTDSDSAGAFLLVDSLLAWIAAVLGTFRD
jgi:hypothetical protein